MRCPAIKELPQPPPSKSGWPWDVESTPCPDSRPDGSPWPKISIVTPSLNQAPFIERTIRSVLLQGYPDIEYIIMDGGSTDRSQEIIKKYEKWLTHWRSQPDNGQSNAINKGFGIAGGTIMAWLNSDDHYSPNAFVNVVRSIKDLRTIAAVVGSTRQIDHVYKRKSIILPRRLSRETLIPWYFGENQIAQPSCFMAAWAVKKAGPLREDLDYVFDYEYWLRLIDLAPFQILEECLSEISVRQDVKTIRSPGKCFAELIRVMFQMGNERTATSILETIWERKHRLENILFRLERFAPYHVLRIAARWLTKRISL